MKLYGLTAAVFCAVVTLRTAHTACEEDCGQLFHGKVVNVDGHTRTVKLKYDFSEAEQLEDFKGIISGKTKKLCPGGMATPCWHKAHFDGDLSIEARIWARGGMCAVLVMVDPVALEGYSFLFGLNDRALGGRSFTGVAKYRQGKDPEIIYRGVLGAWEPKKQTISVLRRGDLLQMKVDNRIVIKTRDSTHTSGRIGLAGDFLVDRLEVNGRLNPRWCEKAVSSGAEPEPVSLFHRMGAQPGLHLKKALPQWPHCHRKETEHYIVMSNASETCTEHYARYAEAMRSLFSAIFQVREKSAHKSRIVLFRTHKGFHEFGGPRLCLGFYLHRNRNLYLYEHVRPEITQKVLVHEGFLQYFNLFVDGPPLWLSEGMARYFETARIVRKNPSLRFEVGAPGTQLSLLRSAIRNRRDLFLGNVVRMANSDFEKPFRKSRNSAHAWGLCHFLIHYKNGRYLKFLESYVESLRRGKTADEAYENAFAALDWDTIQKRWRTYIFQLSKETL